jgi:predicted phosphodiesterase
MRVAVISDIHANRHALDAVLAAVDTASVDELWCLGDLVGYGPKPTECVRAVAARSDLCLCGNHDLGAIGTIDLQEFSGDAARGVVETLPLLDADSRSYLASLQPTGERAGAGLFHGSPDDPVWEYVLSGAAALAALQATKTNLVLVGHTHVPLAISLGDGVLAGGAAPDGRRVELDGKRWLLNPGSVGQPRDGDPRAAFLVLDLEAMHAEFRRVEYPIERTQAEIRALGLPETLAARLAFGE